MVDLHIINFDRTYYTVIDGKIRELKINWIRRVSIVELKNDINFDKNGIAKEFKENTMTKAFTEQITQVGVYYINDDGYAVDVPFDPKKCYRTKQECIQYCKNKIK